MGTEKVVADMMTMFTDALRVMEQNRVASEERLMKMMLEQQNRGTTIQTVPDFSKSVETFDGDCESGAAIEWLEKINVTAEIHSWSNECCLETARNHLVGAARKWYDAHRTEIKTWTDFVTQFKKTFEIRVSTTECWRQMQSRQQIPGESVSTYFHDKFQLCQKLKLPFAETKEQIVVGLSNKNIVQGLVAKSHTDADELLHDIIEFSRILNNSRAFSGINERSIKPSKNINEIKCYNCLQAGHLASKCTQPKQTICFQCKQTGHVAKDCKNSYGEKSQNFSRKPVATVKKEVSLISSHQKPREDSDGIEKYLRVTKVDDVNIHAMIDMGSSVCTVRSSVVKENNWPITRKDVQLFGFGNNSPIPCLGVVNTGIQIDEVRVDNVDICIVADDAQSVDMIIGRPFTENENLIYLRVDDKLIFKKREDFPFSEWEISTDEHKKTAEDSEVVSEECEITEDQIIVDPSTPPEITHELIKLFNEFRSCFAFNLKELGCTDVMKMKIRDTNVPVSAKPYRASLREREIIKNIVRDWKENGIVTETNSQYASPVVLVQKKSGEPRLVVDYRRLNKQTEKVPFPIPSIDEQFEMLSESRIFSTLDLAHGYLQIPLDEESKEKTAFITPDETGQFERLMFGLTNGPYEFCRLMHTVLGPLRNKVCMTYIDDILLGAKDWTDMLDKLKMVLTALKKAKLTLKLRKCVFGLKEVEFLGYTISSEKMQPAKSKMRAISEFPTPKNIHELKRFLGLTSYFRRFLRNYAIRARPLTDLTRKTQTFTWGEDQSAAFEDLRDSLCAEPVLKLYNPKATITELHTDACSAGVAGMLLQTDSAGQLHPVYYISKKTTDVEEKYHSTKLELMAVVWCIERLRNLLIGLKFVVYTDCQAITFLNNFKTQNAQICRWFNLLQEYDVEIKHRPGGRMAHVDALSRAPVDDSQDTLDHIHERLEVLQTLDETDYVLMIQYGDAELRELIQILKKPNEERTPVERQRVLPYKLDSARLLRNVNVNGSGKWLYVIPKSMRKSIVVKHHDQLGHFGVDRTVAKIRERYWFAKMKQYVQRHISACAECLLNKIPSGKRPGELHPPRPPRRPFEKIHLDHVGPLVKTDDENSYILVVIDALTKFVKLYPTKSTKSSESVSALQNCIDNYGIPRLVVADQGSCFKSDEFGEFCDSLGIQVLLIPPRWPQANGQVERVMRTLIPTLMCEMDIEEQWDKKIVKVERNLNSMLNKTTGRVPFEALHGYLPVFDDGKLTKLAEGEDCTWTPPESIQAEIREAIVEKQKAYKRRYDKKKFQGVTYNVGDIVMFKTYIPGGTGQSSKTKAKYRGPLTVIEKLPSDIYRISSLADEGRIFTTTANVSQLKLYRNPIEDTEPEDTESEDSDSSEDELPQIETVEVQIHSTPDAIVTEELPKRNRRMPKKLADYKLF